MLTLEDEKAENIKKLEEGYHDLRNKKSITKRVR